MNSYISNETSKQSVVHACGVVGTPPARRNCYTRVKETILFWSFLATQQDTTLAAFEKMTKKKSANKVNSLPLRKSDTFFWSPNIFLIRVFFKFILWQLKEKCLNYFFFRTMDIWWRFLADINKYSNHCFCI